MWGVYVSVVTKAGLSVTSMFRLLSNMMVTYACLARVVLAAETPSFSGAEGFGAVATGGRGGDVYYVTSLDNDGVGSLRDAIRQGDRTVLFKTSGTINLESKLDIKAANITIAGQTAPGAGICLRGKELNISGENIVVRFLRVRPGDERGEEHDAVTVWGANRVVIDHCSLSWSTDSLNDVVRDSSHVTVQWCILAEPLNESVHRKGAHGYGTGWGSGPKGGNSFHHNLLAHCNSRSPRLGSEQDALVDVRNNVIYNMGNGWAYGGEHARANVVANYYKPGPNTVRPHELFRISSPDTRMYLHDNVISGQLQVTQDNASGLVGDDGIDLAAALVAEPFDVPHVGVDSAENAYELVLTFAGATLPRRDPVDTRVLSEVRGGTGRIISSPREVGGWPALQSKEPPQDSDGDGMPDSWERSHDLDPQNAADGAAYTNEGYTNLEHYLNGLAARTIPLAVKHNPPPPQN